jgi:beta-phosphoglucomutase-like phosphatase (HAD superfamily)
MKLVIPDREFDGYIFDCDGTLADTMPLHFRAWTRIVGELGGSFSEESFYQTGDRQIELTLDALGIRSLFTAVVCVEDYARSKPFPDPFLEAARQLKVPPADCVVFEDSRLGVEAAAAAGMQCVFVPRPS